MEIFIPHLAPSILQRSWWYFAHTYLARSQSAVQNLGPNAQDFAKWWQFYAEKNHTFALFSKSILVTPTEVGRDIARSKGHLVCKFDLLDLDFGKWRLFLWSEIRLFALFSKCFLVIRIKLGRDIARGKRHVVREFIWNDLDLWEKVAILNLRVWNCFFTLFLDN